MTALAVLFLTKNTVKEYTSDCEVYTGIASGYGITSGDNDRVDYFAVNNAFDNLMATIKSTHVSRQDTTRSTILKIPSRSEGSNFKTRFIANDIMLFTQSHTILRFLTRTVRVCLT